MKIVFLQDDFPPYGFGGASSVVFNLTQKLKELGHQVFVITAVQEKDLVGQNENYGLKIYRICSDYHPRWRAYRSLYNQQTVPQVKNILQEIKPDIVHAHNIHYYLSYYCLKLARQYSKAVFLTAHDVMLVHYGKWMPEIPRYKISVFDQIKLAKKRYNPLRNIIIRHYLKNIDKIFTVSSSLKELLQINGIKNIQVIFNGISVNQQENSKAVRQFKWKYNLFDKKVIFFGGTLSQSKGAKNILESFIHIAKEFPQAILLIAGKRERCFEEMKKIAEQNQISNKLIFTGWLDRGDLNTAYQASDICVFPSLCFETFGMFCLEAMAFKKPIVASNFGGSAEVVEDNKTGYVVNAYKVSQLAAAISDLVRDNRKAKQFGQNGFERLKNNFTIEKQALETINWYKNALPHGELKIEELSGVCPVNKDTKKLAEIASDYKKDKVLDLGTGTGYCGIWLAKQGAAVDATDINEKALLCAMNNAKLNKAEMNVYFSDLFSKVTNKYNLIIYNPPVNINETDFQRRIKAVLRKSIFKKILSGLAHKACQKERINNLNNFIKEAENYLTKDGCLLIHLFANDVNLLDKRNIAIREKEKVFPHTAIFEIKYYGSSNYAYRISRKNIR